MDEVADLTSLSDAELIRAYLASDDAADDPAVLALVDEMERRGFVC